MLDTVPAGAGGAICHEITAQVEELARFTSPHEHILDRNVEDVLPRRRAHPHLDLLHSCLSLPNTTIPTYHSQPSLHHHVEPALSLSLFLFTLLLLCLLLPVFLSLSLARALSLSARQAASSSSVLALTSLKSSLTESSVDGPSATPAHHQVILLVISCLALLSDPLDLPATQIWLRGGEQGGEARAH